MKKVIQLEVSKEVSELGSALADMVKVTKQALADGFQPGQDLPAIIVSSVAKFTEIVEGVSNASEEYKEDHAAFIAAVGISVKEIVAVLLEKKA